MTGEELIVLGRRIGESLAQENKEDSCILLDALRDFLCEIREEIGRRAIGIETEEG